MATGVVIINRDGREPTNDVWFFTISGDPTVLGLACGLNSIAVRDDSTPVGVTYLKTGAGDTAWTIQADTGGLDAATITDLTDGGDTTLHFHSADRARANHTGTQTAATITAGAFGAGSYTLVGDFAASTFNSQTVSSGTILSSANKTTLTGGPASNADALHGHSITSLIATGTRDASHFLDGTGVFSSPPGASGGEANTLQIDAANVGGIDPTGTKTGVALQIYGFKANSGRISISRDTTNKNVLIDAVTGTTAGTVASGDVAIDLAQHTIASQAAGDQFISNGTTGLKRVVKGSSGQVWVQGATDPAWSTIPVGALPTVNEIHGGTNQITYARGDLLAASAADTLGRVTVGASGTVLHSNGTDPSWQALVSADLPVIAETKGGTNQTTYATGDLLKATAANTLGKLSIGATNNVLSVVGGLPVWQALTVAQLPALTATKIVGNPQTKTTNYTVLTTDDDIRGDPSSGNIVFTMYAATGNAGRRHRFKYIAAATGTNTVTIACVGADSIDGYPSWVLRSQGEEVEIEVNAAGNGFDVYNASGSFAPVALGNSGTAITATATPFSTYFTTTATGNCTYTVGGMARGQVIEWAIDTGAGGFTATFLAPGRVLKPAGSVTPALTTTASKRDRFFFRDDGTTVWYSTGQGY